MFRAIIVNEDTKHFREVNILKQKYYAFFYKDTFDFHIVTDIEYSQYEDMSDKVKSFYKYEHKKGDIVPEDWDDWNSDIKADFRYFFCDFLEYSDTSFEETKEMFNMIADLYDGLSEKQKEHIMLVQLHLAKKDYLEYISYNDFSISFFERFANSKGISLNRTLTKRNGQKLNINDDTTDIAYRYDSTNFRDIIFASVHFALENGYKLSKCKHCGKWFFVQSLKETYCTRKSTYPEYERYTCKEAVKKIKDKLEKKRISEYERLRLKANEYGSNSKHFQIWSDFCNTCADYKERLKNNSGVDLLQEYERYLFDSKNVRKKYERIKDYK